MERPVDGHYYYYYYLTAIGFTPGSSSKVHIYTQTVHRIEDGAHITIKKKKIGKRKNGK
jgi:hypothetical protein